MTGKIFGAILGTVIILVFGVIAFFPAIQTEVATLNTTYNSSSNYTFLNQAIRATPLWLVVGVLATPVVVVLMFIMAKRQAA